MVGAGYEKPADESADQTCKYECTDDYLSYVDANVFSSVLALTYYAELITVLGIANVNVHQHTDHKGNQKGNVQIEISNGDDGHIHMQFRKHGALGVGAQKDVPIGLGVGKELKKIEQKSLLSIIIGSKKILKKLTKISRSSATRHLMMKLRRKDSLLSRFDTLSLRSVTKKLTMMQK